MMIRIEAQESDEYAVDPGRCTFQLQAGQMYVLTPDVAFRVAGDGPKVHKALLGWMGSQMPHPVRCGGRTVQEQITLQGE